jgi:hypothetical protein
LSTSKPKRDEPRPERWLWIGATGMLAGAVKRLAEPGRSFTLLARGLPALEKLAKAIEEREASAEVISLDYRDNELFRDAIARSVKEHGPFARAICWIHRSAAPEAYETLASVIGAAEGQPQPALFAVLGSADFDPVRQAQRFEVPGVDFRPIRLGYASDGEGPRWLTNAEICAGVAGAVERDAASAVVGRVERLASRPS